MYVLSINVIQNVHVEEEILPSDRIRGKSGSRVNLPPGGNPTLG